MDCVTNIENAGAPVSELPLETITFDSLTPGPKLLVLGAVHGNETCGPIAIARILDEIRSGALKLTRGAVTFVPITNPKAYRLQTREGDRNLNRDLREKPLPQDNEDRIGNPLTALLRRHDMLLDVHSFRGEGVPFVFFGPEDNNGPLEPFAQAAAEASFAACLGTKIIIHGWLDVYAQSLAIRARLPVPKLQPTEGFGTTEYMRFAGGYAVTLECGSHADPASAELGYVAIRNALAHLALVDEAKVPSKVERVIEMDEVILCENDGDKLVGTWKTADPVKAGTQIAVRSCGDKVIAGHDGFIIFPNANAKLGEGICYLGTASERPFV